MFKYPLISEIREFAEFHGISLQEARMSMLRDRLIEALYAKEISAEEVLILLLNNDII